MSVFDFFSLPYDSYSFSSFFIFSFPLSIKSCIFAGERAKQPSAEVPNQILSERNNNKRLLLFGYTSESTTFNKSKPKNKFASVCALGMGVTYLVWWACGRA